MHPSLTLPCLLAVMALGLARAEDAAPTPEIISTDPSWIASFDRVWELVRDTHYDPKINGVDWEAVRSELRPRATAATKLSELRATIEDMLSRLGQSHFELIPGEVQDALDQEASDDTSGGLDAEAEEPDDEGEPGDEAGSAGDSAEIDESDDSGELGLELRLLDGEIVVSSTQATGPAHAAGVRMGWRIDRVGKREVADMISILPEDIDPRMRGLFAQKLVKGHLDGPIGSKVGVAFTDAAGTQVVLELLRAQGPERVSFGNLPPLALRFEERTLEHAGAAYGYIAFNIWLFNVARPFDEAIDTHRAKPGMILDLRGNPGGIGGMVMGIAGHFLGTKESLGTMRTRRDKLDFFVNPRFVDTKSQAVDPYAGKLAILVDGGSASTSEIFAAGLQHLRRARVFGQTSMGAALPATTERLPCGDVFLYAFADYVLPDGTRVEGRGVIPDVVVPLVRTELAKGVDPVIAAALEWLAAPDKK